MKKNLFSANEDAKRCITFFDELGKFFVLPVVVESGLAAEGARAAGGEQGESTGCFPVPDPSLTALQESLKTGKDQSDLAHCGFSRLLLLTRHVETLLGGHRPRKVSLRLGHPNVQLPLTGNTMDDRKALLSPKGGVMRTFGILGLDQVTKAMLMEWWTVEMEGRGRARSTVGNHLNAVSGVLAYAVDLDLIESNPVDVFRGVLRRRRRTKQGRAEAERLDRRNPIESVDRLGAFVRASAAVGADYHLATMLMLDAGLRIGEVEALTWGHVQAGSSPSDPSRSILVTVSRARGRYEGSTKSGRSRRVALSQRLRGLLLERRMERGRPDDSELIFDDFSRKLYRRHFDCVCSAADLEGHTPKDLRDSFASHLLTVGIARSYVALQLGHEDEKTTGRHYAKWIEGDQYRESMALLEGEVPADLIARVVEESHNDSHNGTAGNAAS